MAKAPTLSMDITKLRELAQSLKTRPVIQVGVFSKDTSRKDEMTNATLASIHEHGDQRHGLPARSILVTPLKDHAAEIMASIKGKAAELVDVGRVQQMWKLIGVAAEKIVLGAFKTEGYGKWAPLKYSTMLGKLSGSLRKRKQKIGMIYTGEAKAGVLIRSGQLMRAFSSRLVMRY